MRIDRVVLRDYRNIETASLELGARFTVLHGHNGAGKTNVLEAIYLVSTLRSFRIAELGPLIRAGQDHAQVGVRAYDAAIDLSVSLDVQLQRRGTSTRRTALADGKTVRSSADFYGRVRAVLFTPEDLAILRGGPSGRRQFLDRMIFAVDKAHIGDIQRYEKLLRSRNQLLKREGAWLRERELLETYEQGLAEVGARIWNRRTAQLERLKQPFESAFAHIHGGFGGDASRGVPEVAATYQSRLGTVPPEQRGAALLDGLRDRREDDARRKVTTLGPHRDDIDVQFDGKPAGPFASQGQSRALVLALKLAELRSVAAAFETPLLLLDDVSSELDPRRSQMLYETLGREAGQCLVTTTDARFVTLPQVEDAQWWRVEQGQFSPGAISLSGP